MYKLALVGKNISHSKSPTVYKNLLNQNVDYTLLDYENENLIPQAKLLLNEFDGVSITSPYKKHFNNQIVFLGDAIELQAVNCLRKNQDVIEGINTDYLAIIEILNKFNKSFDEIIILGDGVMSNVCQKALKKLNLNFQVLSRKKNINFSQINLIDLVGNKKVLIINTCSREYVYCGEVTKEITFWDFNYDFDLHKSKLAAKCTYFDGMEMLILQAKFALDFWSIKKLS